MISATGGSAGGSFDNHHNGHLPLRQTIFCATKLVMIYF